MKIYQTPAVGLLLDTQLGRGESGSQAARGRLWTTLAGGDAEHTEPALENCSGLPTFAYDTFPGHREAGALCSGLSPGPRAGTPCWEEYFSPLHFTRASLQAPDV